MICNSVCLACKRATFGLQKSLYYIPKGAVLHAKSGYIANRDNSVKNEYRLFHAV